MPEPFLKNLQEAEKTINTADHMIYVSYPLVNDKNILLKVLLETQKALKNCISSILQYEYLYKRIKLYKNPKENFRVFKERCAARYSLSRDDINKIIELFNLAETHKKSPMEFVKNNKVVILSDNLETKTLNLDKIKQFLSLTKNTIQKAKNIILR